MKVVAYNINPLEREFLAKANQKKHDITLIANPLGYDTINYAAGKDAVIVYTHSDMAIPIIEKLAGLGVKYIVVCSTQINPANKAVQVTMGIKIAQIPADLMQSQTHNAL